MVNRLGPYFDDSPHPAKALATRTPAQQQAARLNGARSRGPVTPAGKQVSRANSLVHGLFSRIVQPPDDYRSHREDYHHIRRALVAEFQPHTFTEAAQIDALASDMLRAARARAIIEAAMRATTLEPSEAEAWSRVRAVRANLRAAQHALQALETAEIPLLPEPVSRRLAGSLADMVASVVGDLEEAEADASTDVPPTPSPSGRVNASLLASRQAVADAEARELAELRKLAATLGRSIGKFQQKHRLAELLSGQRTVNAHDRKRLVAVLRHWLTGTAAWLAGQERTQRRVEQLSNDNLARLSATPERLLLLEQYLSRIERSITRTRDRLDQRRAGFVIPKTRAATED